jgi:O-antigen chain-terminating methyltransferase
MAITDPIRSVIGGIKSVGFSRQGVKRMARPLLVRGAAFLLAHPTLKRRVADTLRRYPGLRARLIGIAGNEALGAAPATLAIESVEQLTARARTVYEDLLKSKKSDRR